jgi:hypothetical protein
MIVICRTGFSLWGLAYAQIKIHSLKPVLLDHPYFLIAAASVTPMSAGL